MIRSDRIEFETMKPGFEATNETIKTNLGVESAKETIRNNHTDFHEMKPGF